MADTMDIKELPILFKKKSKSEVELQQTVADKPLGLPILFKRKSTSTGGVFKYTPELLEGMNRDLGVPLDVNQTNVDKYNQYDEHITRGVTEKGGNPNLVKAIIFQESRMNDQSDSNIVGMRGFPQTTEATMDSINRAKGENYTMDELIKDPYRASQWISDYIDVTSKEQKAESLEEKLILYNASPSALKKYREAGNDLSVLPDETQQYIKQVKYTLEKIGDSGEWGGITQPKATPLIPKQEWQDDPTVEELKGRDEVSAWTSAYNFAKYKTQQDNADTDVANQKIQGIDVKEKQIIEKTKAESKAFEQQQKAEFDALTTAYNDKTKKLKEKLDKTLPKTKTPQEYEGAVKEYNDALKAENDSYSAKWEEKKVKYNEQAQKLTEGFEKEKEQFGKEAEGLNKELKQLDKKNEIQTSIITDKKIFQNIIDNAPEDYQGKKEFIKKQVTDAVDDYIYSGGEDINGFKEELYAVINEKLLIDKDGMPTNYALKNQAEIGKQKLKKRFNEISELKIAYDRNAGIRGGQYPRVKFEENPYEEEFSNLAMAVQNYDQILNIPEPKKKGEKAGGFFGGFGSEKEVAINILTNNFAAFMKSAKILGIASKGKSGIPLTESEQAVIDSIALIGSASEKLSEGLRPLYKAGQYGAKSLEWMTSMATTSGIYSKVFKGVLKGLGYKVGAKILSKNLPKYIAAEAAGAIARIPFQVPFYTDVLQRTTNIVPEAGKFSGTIKGEAYYSKESFAKNFITATYSQWAENISEMGGKYIDFAFSKLGRKAVESLSKRFNLGALTRVAKSKAAQGFNEVTNRIGISSPVSEFIEEKIAEVLHWVDGSTQPKDIYDPYKNWVTFLAVATMVAPFSVVRLAARTKGDANVSDFLSKDQISSLDKITVLKDIEAKAKQLGNFILDNNLHENFEQQQLVAKHVWDTQQQQVAEEMAKPETEVTETGSRYSQGGFEVSKEVAQEAIENAETVQELQQIGVKDDEELKKRIAAKANNLELLKQEESRFDKEIEAAGVNEKLLAQAQKEHAKRKSLILSGKQVEETVKEEQVKKDTEIKTEISDTQLTENLTSEQKGETVKEEIPNFTSAQTVNRDFKILTQKIGNKKAVKYFEQVDKLFNPNSTKVVEYRTNGVVTEENGKYIFHALSGMDTKTWRVGFKSDVSDQFNKPQEPSKVAKEMKAQFDKFSQKAKNALPHVIVDSIEQLPKELQENKALKESRGAKIQAILDPKTNTIYFIAPNIPKNQVLAKWVHEQGIHRGLEVLIPKKQDRDTLLKKVFNSVGIDKIKNSIPKVYGVKFDAGKLSEEGIAEEYLAFLAEKIIKEEDLTPEEKSVWKKIKEWIDKIIRKTYGNAKLTDKEIAEVIRASVKSIYAEEAPKPKQGNMKQFIEENKTEIFNQLESKGLLKKEGEC
jgi:hypothetical protein